MKRYRRFFFVTGAVTFYVNGEITGSPIVVGGVQANMQDVAHMYLGFSSSPNALHCFCSLAEVEIYRRALTAKEIQDSYTRVIKV